MRYIRGTAAVLAVFAVTATAAHAQSFVGGDITTQREGFGLALALGENELFIGEPGNSAGPGVVHIYRRANGGWEKAGRLTAADSAAADGFGQQLALDGTTLFVGVPSNDDNRGAVYVFERGTDGWTQADRINATDLDETSRFGTAIAVSGDIAFISAPAQRQGTGAVYVFRRTADGWEQAGKMAAVPAVMPGDSTVTPTMFGYSLAYSQDRLFVSSPALNENSGQVTVFAHDPQTDSWAIADTLPSPELEPNDRFGWSVTAADGIVVVSAPVTADATGAAYTYRQDESGDWFRNARLDPDPAVPNTAFGIGVAFDGTDLLVGAPGADTARGAVFHFTRADDGAFSRPQRISPATTLDRAAQFGGRVAVRGDIAAVSIAGADHGLGAVLVFERDNGIWAQRAMLEGPTHTLASIRGDEIRCSSDGMAAEFKCHDVEMLSFLSIPDLGGDRGVNLNDIWGWTDPQTGREFALVGRIDGMSVVDVSDATNPVYVANLPLTEGANPASWRDIKVYRDHAYIVADGAGPHGMQVLDLTKLRTFSGTPLELEPDTIYRNINSAHNIVINEESGFAYVVGARQGGETCGGGLHMIDIREPLKPTFAGCFSDPQTGRSSTGYSHDAQCVIYHGPDTRYQGREICLGSNETALSIADVTDKDDPRALSRAGYPSVGYTHQGWLDSEHRYFYMNDELDEMNDLTPKTRTLIWDLADLEDPQLVREHMGVEASTDHNLYIIGDLMYQSNYKSGLRILDISDRENPREVGFFKTYPGEDAAAGFEGSWSNYPYFRSGIIIVSSIGEGLFVLKKRDTETVF